MNKLGRLIMTYIEKQILLLKNFPYLLLIETSLGNISRIRLNLCYYYNIQLYDSNLATTPNIELKDKIFGMILGLACPALV